MFLFCELCFHCLSFFFVFFVAVFLSCCLVYFCLWLPLFIMNPVPSHRRCHASSVEGLSDALENTVSRRTMSELSLGRAVVRGRRTTLRRRCSSTPPHSVEMRGRVPARTYTLALGNLCRRKNDQCYILYAGKHTHAHTQW